MKKIYIICSAIVTLLFTTTSCGDSFLSVEPASSVPIDGYYNNQEHIMEALTAAYDPLQWYDYFNGWAPLSLVYDCMSDDVYVGGGSTSDQNELHLISQYKSDPIKTISGAWTASYSGINRANLVINDTENSNLEEGQKQLIIAEAKVVRSFYYSILWKLWGNVPFYEKNLTYPYIAEQKSADEIYTIIEKELDEVLKMNILPMKREMSEAGRVTQAMASMLYCEFVMIQNDEQKYNNALNYMKAIINSNQYSLQPFENLWETSFEWNNETIFDINYIAKGGKRGWGNPNTTGGTVLQAMISIDGLTGSPDYVAGWGFEPVAKEAYDCYEEKDRRRDIGILNIEKYIEENAEKGITITYGGRYQNTGLFLRKYLGRIGGNDGCLGDSDLNWDNNLRIYRFAETLLNAAELAVKVGDNENAKIYLNQIRNRAGVENIEPTLENILLERRREFIGEGKRYFDLIRYGKAEEVLTAKGGKVLNKKGGTYSKDGIPERVQWTPNKRYLPIPQSEIEAAQGTLTQNPY